jgi:hypothetical protein
MTLRELKDFVNNLPEEMDNFGVVNGEVGYVDPEDENSMVYRLDKPIIALYVDQQSEEICLFHQTQDDVTSMMGNGDIEDL